jgi:predicted Zn finger-like uncharacterized protein
MFTVCPKCALTLVVTAADLRVAQGYVRCGRCSSVFNALARLSEERQSAQPGGEAAGTSAPPPGASPEEEPADLSPLEEALARPGESEPSATEEEPIPEDALEFNPETADVGVVFVAPRPNPQWTAATGSFKSMKAASQEPPAAEPPAAEPPAGEPEGSQVEVEIDAAFLAQMLREPAAPESESRRTAAPPARPAAPSPATPSRESPVPRATPAAATQRDARPSAPRPPSARHAAPHARPPTEASAAPPPAAERTLAMPERQAPVFHEEALAASLEVASDEVTADDEEEKHRVRLPRVPARLRQPLWGAGAALAVLVLLAQIVNHYRDELAASASFNRPLTALYRSLGVQLMPHWDLRAYEVRQLGASADPAAAGLITVRASIKNSGREPQPLPLLRVTLQDRFGNRIAARDVAPRFYVPHTMPDTSYLAGGQRIDAEMGFVDPGVNAVGFEIDVCLQTSGGGVTCANDLAPR